MVLLKRNSNELLIAAADSIIQCNFDKSTDHHIKIPDPILPDNLTKGQIEVLKSEVRTITSLEFSTNGQYTVVSTENKQVVVYDQHFNVVKNFIVTRAASKVCFTPENDILVADKTGDVYLYKLSSDVDQPVLLLGHLSVILDMLLSKCGKYIITCDRDEKIRVSHFPNCYNIASYCLGHTEFVTSIKLFDEVLVSASGDGTVRFWDFITGNQLGLVNVNEHIDPKELSDFSQEMDKEKVEVSALPIIDLQVHYDDNSSRLYFAVSVYHCKSIQLYSTDLKKMVSCFVTKLSVDMLLGFSFTSELYVLSNQLLCFQLIKDDFVEKDLPLLQPLHHKYKVILSQASDDFVTGLYKRKYDNVQEYLERKKQRLEGNNKC
ncbi:unnamed protein product [Phaedon cochleariae]|uniref:tRNA (guanine-N(7)-)-methyltransferase non-catalytic subunit wuho n=1 Tax=Phaedon cochleariae TaxID=80249 RepID=A0A9N9SBE1_PHACE|nr:unnamed protein product [Phaedon cochleariae]